MYVASVNVSNILRFHDEANVDLSFERPDGRYEGWTVLAGRNGSGKTSLLRCLALVIGGIHVAPRVAPGYTAWRYDKDLKGEVKVGFSLYSDYLNSNFESEAPWKSGLPYKGTLVLNDHGYDKREWFVSDNKAGRALEDSGKGAWMSGCTYTAGYGPFRRLSSDSSSPQLRLADPDDDPGQVMQRANRFATLFQDDVALSAVIPWLVGLHLRDLEGEAGQGELLRTVLDLLSDGLLPDDYRVAKVDSRGLWVSHEGQTYPLREMSDGQRTVAALVLDIARGLHDFYGHLNVHRDGGSLSINLPGIVLIDEIDTHLHVSWQKRIGGWLTAHFPKIQFIVTTHSPYICQAADPGGLIRLPGPGERTGPQQVSEDLYRRVVYGSGDDAVLSELFGLDSPYSERAEGIRRELIGLESKLFRGEASEDEERRYHELSETLASSPSARIDEVAARLGRRE